MSKPIPEWIKNIYIAHLKSGLPIKDIRVEYADLVDEHLTGYLLTCVVMDVDILDKGMTLQEFIDKLRSGKIDITEAEAHDLYV